MYTQSTSKNNLKWFYNKVINKIKLLKLKIIMTKLKDEKVNIMTI